MKVIIAAAGEGRRWGMHGGIRKHQARVRGVPLLVRQIGQWQAAGIRPTVLVHPDHPYDYPGADYVAVRPDSAGPLASGIGKVYSSRDLWSPTEPTLISFGDVYYSPAGFRKLLPTRPEWAVYGRLGERRRQLFALRIHPHEHQLIAAGCEAVAGMDGQSPPRWGRLMLLYRHMTGQSTTDGGVQDAGHLVWIDDVTDDVDSPRAHRRLRARVKGRRSGRARR